MKLAGFLVLIAFLQIPLSGESQNLSFSGKEIPLKDVFRIIKCQTGVLFFYDEALLKDAKPVTINWKNITLEKALNEIFNDQPFAWMLEGKTVTVIKKLKQMPAEITTLISGSN
jgi:hypothetical protein